MDNFNDLKALWHSANTDNLPSSAAMLQLIKKFRREKLRKKWIIIVGCSLTTFLMVAVMFNYHSRLISTRIGELLITSSCLMLVVNNIRSLKRFYQLQNCSNAEFLAFIEKTRQNQIYYYKKTQGIIMMLCSVGLLVYLYEPALREPYWTAIVYIATIIYLLIIWFVVRPKVFRKNAEKLNAMRERLENIAKQLN